MKLISLVITIAAVTATVAVFDVLTPAQLVGATLFTFPLAVCTVRRSEKRLRGSAAGAAILAGVADLWGPGQANLRDPWVASV